VFATVVGKFREWQHGSPVILIFVAIASKVLLQRLILSFRLPVSLRMESSTETLAGM
jgi:hypothetical protein